MIYNKPRDLSWKLLPSLSVKKAKSTKHEESTSTDNLINDVHLHKVAAPTQNDVDIILDGKAKFVEELQLDENTIIDLTTMPIIEGIPILQFPDEPYKEPESTVKKKPSAPPPVKKADNGKDSKKESRNSIQTQKSTKNNKPHKKAYTARIATFFVLLYFGAVVSFIIPIRPTYSEAEKRNLTEFPAFSVDALLSGDYFGGISTWFSDTFPFRETFTMLNLKIKELYGTGNVAIHGEIDTGDDIPDTPLEEPPSESTSTLETTLPTTTESPTTKPVTMPTDDELSQGGDISAQKPDYSTQNLGAIIVAGNSGYEYYSFSQSLAPRYINTISALNEKAKPSNNVFAMVVPTSIDITLNDALRAEVNSANQKKALDYFNGSIKNAVTVNSVYDTLRNHRDEYIYFRTDHHWTALGAYYAYVEFCNTKGITPVALSSYNTVTYNNFTGTFYTSAGQSSTLKENADYVTTYTPFNNHTCTITKEDGAEYEWDIVKDVSDYGTTLKYLTFIGGDNPLTTIVNQDNPDGETCIVIKDSYGNAFVPFLVPHYSKIYVIDPRHFGTQIEDFANDKQIDDVIFISNISTTRNKIFIESMEELVK